MANDLILIILYILPLLLIGGNGEKCSAGKGGDPVAIRTSGKCLKYITDEGECRNIANADSSRGGYRWSVSWSGDPTGCYIGDGGNYYYYNTRTTSTLDCNSYAKCVCDTKTCQTCPQGYYSPGGNDVTCTKCGKGKYSDQTGQSECKTCLAGKYSNKEGETNKASCLLCAAGKYNTKEGQTNEGSCLLCAAGKYNTEEDPE